jgi:membrane protein required for colicin V production
VIASDRLEILCMNGFDAAISICAIFAVVTGFNVGLLRSTATILGYLSAMPVAVATTSLVSPALAGQSGPPWAQNSLLFVGIFLVCGVALAAVLRMAVSEAIGPSVSLADRVAGAALGGVRVVLVAVTIVLIFDQLIPLERQPGFLNGSRLRPVLSVAGQMGLRSLPAELTAFVDQWKRDQRL